MTRRSGREPFIRHHAPSRGPVRWLALAAFVPAIAGGCWIEVDEDAADFQSAVEGMLVESAAAWNRGELDGFMDDYLRSDATTYIGSSGMLTGYDAIRGRFALLFAPGIARDSLRFEDIRARRLGAVDGVVTGRWTLHRHGTVTGSGPFTRVLRRTGTGWRIIHDHYSTDPRPPAGE